MIILQLYLNQPFFVIFAFAFILGLALTLGVGPSSFSALTVLLLRFAVTFGLVFALGPLVELPW